MSVKAQVEFHGANCLRFKAPGISIVVDDNLEQLQAKSITTAKDVVCLTDSEFPRPKKAKLIFDMPGDYEVSGVFITGVRANPWLENNPDDQPRRSTIYKITVGNIDYVVSGHIQPALDDTQLQRLGSVDVLFVPVGGGQTLDATAAWELSKNLSPKVIVPTYYQQAGIKFANQQEGYEAFIKRSSLEPEIISANLKLKKADFQEQTMLKILAS